MRLDVSSGSARTWKVPCTQSGLQETGLQSALALCADVLKRTIIAVAQHAMLITARECRVLEVSYPRDPTTQSHICFRLEIYTVEARD